jgi:hypothetical protein
MMASINRASIVAGRPPADRCRLAITLRDARESGGQATQKPGFACSEAR